MQIDPSQQRCSLEALIAPHVDLANLPNAGLWESLCQGLTACLASTDKQISTPATSQTISLFKEFSRLSDHACTAQLFFCIAEAADGAASVHVSEAIWQACLHVLKSLAMHLPQTCMYHSDAVLEKLLHAFCQMVKVCLETADAPLQHSILANLGGSKPMTWWHSWLARSKIAKVNFHIMERHTDQERTQSAEVKQPCPSPPCQPPLGSCSLPDAVCRSSCSVA